MNGERTVAWTFLAAMSIIAGAAIFKGNLPKYREIFGVTGAWLLMAFMAKAAPAVAGSLSLLVLVTITLVKAGTFLAGFQKFLGGKGSSKSAVVNGNSATTNVMTIKQAQLQRKDVSQ